MTTPKGPCGARPKRASQRAGRMASLKWYGMSNSRPVVGDNPDVWNLFADLGLEHRRPIRWPATVTTVVVRPGNGLY